jgi:hypothetical protein
MNFMNFRLLIAFVILFTPIAALAQDDTAAACADEVEKLIAVMRQYADDAEAMDDPLDAALSLVPIANTIYNKNALCNGLTFEGSEGSSPLLGPFAIPDGIYRVRLVTDGYFTAEFTPVAGECEVDSLMFVLFEGQATDGVEILMTTSGGCMGLVEVSNVTADWTLEFQQVAAS